jgi:2-amino-4-hydroxy-6-hydroxymethyldihydropteridine diphosphokinase
MAQRLSKSLLQSRRQTKGGNSIGSTRCGNMNFQWGERTYIMGIGNISSDPFPGDSIAEPGQSTAYLSLGSNMGERMQNLADALDMLAHKVKINNLSSIYETEPVGFTKQPRFLNAVCRISTKLEPLQLLIVAKTIETKLGRVPSFPDAPRPMDIDILFYDRLIIHGKALIIPHPRLISRAFVLVPLAEIASRFSHPELGKTINELLDDLGKIEGVTKFAEAAQVAPRRQDVPGICRKGF